MSPGIHAFRAEGTHPTKQGKEAGCSSTIGGRSQLPKEGCQAGGDCPAGEGIQAEAGRGEHMGTVAGLMS